MGELCRNILPDQVSFLESKAYYMNLSDLGVCV